MQNVPQTSVDTLVRQLQAYPVTLWVLRPSFVPTVVLERFYPQSVLKVMHYLKRRKSRLGCHRPKGSASLIPFTFNKARPYNPHTFDFLQEPSESDAFEDEIKGFRRIFIDSIGTEDGDFGRGSNKLKCMQLHFWAE